MKEASDYKSECILNTAVHAMFGCLDLQNIGAICEEYLQNVVHQGVEAKSSNNILHLERHCSRSEDFPEFIFINA